MPVSSFLQVTIPSGQRQAHVVEVEGDFDADWGVEVHTVNPHEAEVDRVRELTIAGNRFHFQSLYLNETGYHFFIKMNRDTYQAIQASPRTEFRVIQRSV